MRDRHSVKRRRAAAAVALVLALGASTAAALAQEATDEDENVPLDTKIFRRIMKDWGFRRNGDNAGIDYRERAPLVLPPNSSLPPPQDEAVTGTINNPAWPVDPDVKRRKQEAAAEKAKLKGHISAEEQSRALRPSELDPTGRTPGETGGDGGAKGPARSVEDSSRALSPSELGTKNPFGSLFSSIGPSKAETAPFTGEPARSSMTDPPTGYQTPSPSQPYGLGVAKDHYQAPKPEDMAVGSAQAK